MDLDSVSNLGRFCCNTRVHATAGIWTASGVFYVHRMCLCHVCYIGKLVAFLAARSLVLLAARALVLLAARSIVVYLLAARSLVVSLLFPLSRQSTSINVVATRIRHLQAV